MKHLKTLFSIIAACCLIALSLSNTACTTTTSVDPNTGVITTNTVFNEFAVDGFALGLESTSYFLAQKSINDHPSNREWFSTAIPIIRAAASTEPNPDPVKQKAALTDALSKIKVDGVDTANMKPIIDGVSKLYITTYTAWQKGGGTAPQLAELINAVADGFQLAVAPPASGNPLDKMSLQHSGLDPIEWADKVAQLSSNQLNY